jgi:hypothetical protein
MQSAVKVHAECSHFAVIPTSFCMQIAVVLHAECMRFAVTLHADCSQIAVTLTAIAVRRYLLKLSLERAGILLRSVYRKQQ